MTEYPSENRCKHLGIYIIDANGDISRASLLKFIEGPPTIGGGECHPVSFRWKQPGLLTTFRGAEPWNYLGFPKSPGYEKLRI